MAISTQKHRAAVEQAFKEGYAACWRARAQASIGLDTAEPDQAWRASEAFRALSGDGEG
jgi:hypothetical protein